MVKEDVKKTSSDIEFAESATVDVSIDDEWQ